MSRSLSTYLYGPLYSTICLCLFLCTSCSNPKQEATVVEQLPQVDPGIFADLDSSIIAAKALELDEKFTRLQLKAGFNGAVLYAEKGRVIFKKAYGYENVRRKKDSLRTTSSFQLASVSKMFTATAIMILKNDGRLDYDLDIRTYLPDFPYEGVSVRMLLTHRAGLPRYMSLAQDEWKNKKIPLGNDDMLQLFTDHPRDSYFSPDNGFHYCNTNYAVLASIVESVSGLHFDQFMKQRVFDPLNMHDSFVYHLRNDSVVPLYVDKGVPGYYHRGWRWREMTNDYLNGVMGDKNMYTSVEDFYKFDRAMDQQTLLPDSILREAFQPGSPKYWKRKDNYGFGWRIREERDSTIYHFGWWKGFRSFYIRDMKYGKTLIVLSNKDKGPGSENFWNIIKADTLPIGWKTDLQSR